ncbi:MAG: sensory histidine kinase AtoS [Methanocella sp. PtaU1.Bin125]|nr:MAG: sensory histidine kinase AtoS [Methanocella sp. PtaU1.Bin125]
MRCPKDDFHRPVEELIEELNELRRKVAVRKGDDAFPDCRAGDPAYDADILSKAFDSVQDGLSILDRDLNVIRVNRVMEEWYRHMTPIPGKKCFFAYHGRDKPCDVCPSLRAMELKTAQSEIHQLHCVEGGEPRWIEIFAYPMIDDRGNVTGVVEQVRDVTRRKEIDMKLKMTQFSVDRAADMAVWLDPDGTIRYVNEAYCKASGYAYDELIGHKIFGVNRNFDVSNWAEHWEETKRRGSMTFESTNWRKDGTVFPVEVTINFLVYEGHEMHCTFARDITDRKHSEESLRLMQHMIDQTLDEASLAGPDGRFVYVNDAKCRSLGYTREELLSLYVWDVDPDMTRERWPEAFQDLKRRGSIKVETLHRGKDGRQFPAEVWTTYLNFQGKDYVCAFVRDTTERKKVENAFRVASAYNRSLIEASVDPLVTIAPDGRITDVNAATEAVTGLPRDRLVGTDFSDYFTEPAKAMDGYRTAFSEGSVKDYPLEIRHRDGHVTPVIYNASVYRGESGKVIGVFAAARDITERKKAEEALQESERKFRVLADSTDASIILYRGNNYIYVNPRLEENTGYSKEDLASMNFWDMVHPDHREMVREYGMSRQRGKDVPATYEFKILTKRGETKWVEVTSTLIEYEGKPTVLSTVFDITDRKRTEAELQEAKSQAELYLDLMGHDINNLNQIGIGFLEMALETLKLSREERDLIARPLDALEASTRLIANVRKLQKVREGGLKFHDINVKKMIRDIVPRYADVPGRKVSINYTAGCDCVVRGNDLLDDVFSNIIGNAIKHSRGALNIDVFVSNVKIGEREYCLVAIEDDGPGIPDSLKERLFTRFDESGKKERRKGIGMYLVNTLVHDFHGKVWVEDRVRGDHTRGARFMIMLPAAEK